MTPIREFWVVMHEDGSVGAQYTSVSKARDVAEMFARENPGKAYVVLKAIESCVASDVTWAYALPSDSPW